MPTPASPADSRAAAANAPTAAPEELPAVAETGPAAPPLPGPPAAGPRRRPRTAGNVLLLGTYILFAGLTPVAAKDAMHEMPPMTAGALRFTIAAALFILTRAVLRARGVTGPVEPIAPGDWLRFVVAGFLCVPLNQYCFLQGLEWSNAAHSGLLYGLSPVLIYMLTLATGQARRSLRMAAASVLAFGGAAVIALDGLDRTQSTSSLLGDLLLFGAVATWAGYTVIVAPLASRYGALRCVTIVLTAGSLLYAPAYFIDGGRLDVTALSPRALWGFIFISVFTGYLNYMLWFVAMTRIDLNRLTISTNLTPLVTVLAAYLWHADPITTWLLVGAGGIVTAITLANWDRFRAVLSGGRSGIVAPRAGRAK